MKITFKRHPKATGLASVGYPYPCVDIKHQGRVIGLIVPPTYITKDNFFRVKIAVKAPDGNSFVWRVLTRKGTSEEEARAIAKEVIPTLNVQYYYFED